MDVENKIKENNTKKSKMQKSKSSFSLWEVSFSILPAVD